MTEAESILYLVTVIALVLNDRLMAARIKKLEQQMKDRKP